MNATFPARDSTSGRPKWATAVEDRVAQRYAPGIVNLAAWPDRTEIFACGVSDVANGALMREDALFRIASVTKIVTAVTALILVDQGLLDLDAPIDHWLPELAGRQAVSDIYGPILFTSPVPAPTLRHLLSMTNGDGSFFGQTARSPLIEKLSGRQAFSWTASISSEQFLADLSDLPAMFPPGRRWLYHLGFELAGIVIERATGERLGAVMKNKLLDPLGMKDTGFTLDKSQIQRLAALSYQLPSKSYGTLADWEADRTCEPLMHRGGGGLISSAQDLGRLGRLLLNGGKAGEFSLLSPQLIEEMVRDHVPPLAKIASPVFDGFWQTYNYGLGVCIARLPDRISSVPGRFGWWGGTGTALFMDPERDVAMVSLTQRMISSLDDSGNADTFMAAVLAG